MPIPYAALLKNDLPAIQAYLENKPEEMNDRFKDGSSPIEVAAALGTPEVFSYLLNHKSLKLRSQDSLRIFFNAIKNRKHSEAIIKIFLAAKDKKWKVGEGLTELHIAIVSNDEATAKALIAKAPEQFMQGVSRELTPFWWCVLLKDVSLFQEFFSRVAQKEKNMGDVLAQIYKIFTLTDAQEDLIIKVAVQAVAVSEPMDRFSCELRRLKWYVEALISNTLSEQYAVEIIEATIPQVLAVMWIYKYHSAHASLCAAIVDTLLEMVPLWSTCLRQGKVKEFQKFSPADLVAYADQFQPPEVQRSVVWAFRKIYLKINYHDKSFLEALCTVGGITDDLGRIEQKIDAKDSKYVCDLLCGIMARFVFLAKQKEFDPEKVSFFSNNLKYTGMDSPWSEPCELALMLIAQNKERATQIMHEAGAKGQLGQMVTTLAKFSCHRDLREGFNTIVKDMPEPLIFSGDASCIRLQVAEVLKSQCQFQAVEMSAGKRNYVLEFPETLRIPSDLADLADLAPYVRYRERISIQDVAAIERAVGERHRSAKSFTDYPSVPEIQAIILKQCEEWPSTVAVPGMAEAKEDKEEKGAEEKSASVEQQVFDHVMRMLKEIEVTPTASLTEKIKKREALKIYLADKKNITFSEDRNLQIISAVVRAKTKSDGNSFVPSYNLVTIMEDKVLFSEELLNILPLHPSWKLILEVAFSLLDFSAVILYWKREFLEKSSHSQAEYRHFRNILNVRLGSLCLSLKEEKAKEMLARIGMRGSVEKMLGRLRAVDNFVGIVLTDDHKTAFKFEARFLLGNILEEVLGHWSQHQGRDGEKRFLHQGEQYVLTSEDKEALVSELLLSREYLFDAVIQAKVGTYMESRLKPVKEKSLFDVLLEKALALVGGSEKKIEVSKIPSKILTKEEKKYFPVFIELSNTFLKKVRAKFNALSEEEREKLGAEEMLRLMVEMTPAWGRIQSALTQSEEDVGNMTTQELREYLEKVATDLEERTEALRKSKIENRKAFFNKAKGFEKEWKLFLSGEGQAYARMRKNRETMMELYRAWSEFRNEGLLPVETRGKQDARDGKKWGRLVTGIATTRGEVEEGEGTSSPDEKEEGLGETSEVMLAGEEHSLSGEETEEPTTSSISSRMSTSRGTRPDPRFFPKMKEPVKYVPNDDWKVTLTSFLVSYEQLSEVVMNGEVVDVAKAKELYRCIERCAQYLKDYVESEGGTRYRKKALEDFCDVLEQGRLKIEGEGFDIRVIVRTAESMLYGMIDEIRAFHWPHERTRNAIESLPRDEQERYRSVKEKVLERQGTLEVLPFEFEGSELYLHLTKRFGLMPSVVAVVEPYEVLSEIEGEVRGEEKVVRPEVPAFTDKEREVFRAKLLRWGTTVLKLPGAKLVEEASRYGFACSESKEVGNGGMEALEEHLKRKKLEGKIPGLRESMMHRVIEEASISHEVREYMEGRRFDGWWLDKRVWESASRTLHVTIVVVKAEGGQPEVFKPAEKLPVVILGYEGGRYLALKRGQEERARWPRPEVNLAGMINRAPVMVPPVAKSPVNTL